VLRKPDVAAACAAIGVRVPPNAPKAADVPDLHGPWSAALAVGLLEIDDDTVASGPALGSWPPAGAASLGTWFAAFRAVCDAMADRRQEDSSAGMLAFALALLSVLTDEVVPTGKDLWQAVLEEGDDICSTYDLDVVPAAAMRRVARQPGDSPLSGIVALLSSFGAVTGTADKPAITALGRWAIGQLTEALPGAADPDISAAELIATATAESVDANDRWKIAAGWLDQHDPAELLEAAESMSPSQRLVAAELVEGLGEDALKAWHACATRPNIGPHARWALYALGKGPEPDEADMQWLGTERAAAALASRGPDEALCTADGQVRADDLDGRLAAMRATGHPVAGKLVSALTALVESGAALSIDQGMQLKVALKYTQPVIWRSVQLPVAATLGHLHEVIQLLFGWDGDHLHVFRAAGRAYSDPFYDLEGASDEDSIRVRDAFRPGIKVGYEYDFGASWQHEITRQKSFRLDPEQNYPVCVAYQGDSPVEYPSEDDEPQEPEPFSLTDVNRKLANYGR
jgi:hypothetical protein